MQHLARTALWATALILLLLSLEVSSSKKKGRKTKTAARGRNAGAGGGAAAGDGAWEDVQAPLASVIQRLWVPDPALAVASPASAVAALKQSTWAAGSPPAELLPPLMMLGEAAARAEQVEIVVEAVRLMEDLSTLVARGAGGSKAAPDQIADFQRRIAQLYTNQFIPLVQAGLLGVADRCNARGKAIAAAVSIAVADDGRSAGRHRRAAVGDSAVLLSSSHWATVVITLVRGFHQHAAGSAPWQRLRRNLQASCPSAALNDEAWQELEGAPVVRWASLASLLEACLVDAGTIGTMVRAEGGAVDATTTSGWSPLHHAALLSSGRLAAELLGLGADPYAQTELLGYTALHVAASRGAVEVVRELLEHDPALVHSIDAKNRTAVELVCLQDSSVTRHTAASEESSWMGEMHGVLLHAGSAPCAAGDDSDDSKPAAPPSKPRRSKWSEHFADVDELAAARMQQTHGLPPSLWNKEEESECGIAVREGSELSGEAFYNDFVSLNRPVFIRRAAAAPKGGAWSIESLRGFFGAEPLQSVNIPYASMFVDGVTSETTMGRFLESMEDLDEAEAGRDAQYIFQTVSPAQEEHLRSSASPRLPTVLAGKRLQTATRPGKFQLYVGPAGSGSPVHWHNDAVNYAVHGSKLWTLQPPPHAVYSRRHATVDMAEYLNANSNTTLHCVQRAGDLIFVPDGWGHGVLNLEASAGYAQSWNGEHKLFAHDVPHKYMYGGKESTLGGSGGW